MDIYYAFYTLLYLLMLGVKEGWLDNMFPCQVHHTPGPLPPRGAGRGPPRGDDQRSRPGGREEIRHLLPVGRLHTLLPGCTLLPAEVTLHRSKITAIFTTFYDIFTNM